MGKHLARFQIIIKKKETTGIKLYKFSIYGQVLMHHSSFNRHMTSHTTPKSCEYQEYEEKPNAKNVGRLLSIVNLDIRMRRFTVERNPMIVRNVGRPSSFANPFKDMKEFTLERNPMNVKDVEKPSDITTTFKNMNELILERNPIDVSTVVKPSVLSDTVEFMK